MYRCINSCTHMCVCVCVCVCVCTQKTCLYQPISTVCRRLWLSAPPTEHLLLWRCQCVTGVREPLYTLCELCNTLEKILSATDLRTSELLWAHYDRVIATQCCLFWPIVMSA